MRKWLFSDKHISRKSKLANEQQNQVQTFRTPSSEVLVLDRQTIARSNMLVLKMSREGGQDRWPCPLRRGRVHYFIPLASLLMCLSVSYLHSLVWLTSVFTNPGHTYPRGYYFDKLTKNGPNWLAKAMNKWLKCLVTCYELMAKNKGEKMNKWLKCLAKVINKWPRNE